MCIRDSVRGGWTITGSWPIATEMGSRLRARDSAALATSVHLVCRPRPDDAPVGDWGEVLRELPQRVGNWIEYLQEQGVRGADLVFCLLYTSPSTLHLWWARRPLAACRAMLLALLLPDPCDPNCPEEFKTKARKLLQQLTGYVGPEDLTLRKAILKFRCV